MAQNTKNQRGKNVILIGQSSDDHRDFGVPHIVSRASSFGNYFDNFQQNGFARQSSITGNLFKTFHTNEKLKEEPPKLLTEPPKINDTQKYAQQCLEYEKYEFDDRIRLTIHRMSIRAYQNFRDKLQHKFLSFSIQKMLGIIVKKLLLNRFELLFLEYVFEQTKWKFDIDCIAEHENEFASYAHISDNEGMSHAIKQLQVYFLFCGFYSKKSLNELPMEGKSSKGHNFSGLTHYLKNQLCKKFNTHYQEWTQKSNVSNIKISPKVLNSIFKRLTFYSDRDTQDVENYNLLVEQILQISPAYNAQKGAKKRKTNKMKKEQQQISEQKEEEEQEEQKGPFHRMQQQQQQSDGLGPIPMNTKKQTSYLSNVDGLDALNYIKNQKMI